MNDPTTPAALHRAIGEALTGRAADRWNGSVGEEQNEIVIIAQRKGLQAAIDEVTEAAEYHVM